MFRVVTEILARSVCIAVHVLLLLQACMIYTACSWLSRLSFQIISTENKASGFVLFSSNTDCHTAISRINQAGAALVTVLPDDSVSGIALETFVAFPLLFVIPAVCGVAGFALTGLK